MSNSFFFFHQIFRLNYQSVKVVNYSFVKMKDAILFWFFDNWANDLISKKKHLAKIVKCFFLKVFQ